MKRSIVSILLLSAGFFAMSQSRYEGILQQIEENNTMLRVSREQMNSQKLNNRTGIYPNNPEVEFHYLWGSPNSIGNRTDFNVKQTFDFPSVYSYRNRIAGLQNTKAELSYKTQRMYLLLSVKQICIELSYYNALAKEYELRLENAKRIADVYNIKLEMGETNILENNKAQLNFISIQTETMRIKTEQTTLLSELKQFNGGKDITFSDDLSSRDTLPEDFEQWYVMIEEKNALLQSINGQIEIDKQQIKLNRALGLPKFSAGYMSEQLPNEHFQGVNVSISIPLWENKNNVKQAKAQLQSTESSLEDGKIQLYNRLKNIYLKASTLQKNVQEIKQSISIYSNASLLKKALDAGEISLLNYLQETAYYYEVMKMFLETERDFDITVSELLSVDL
jgi:outer membrane protein TolC